MAQFMLLLYGNPANWQNISPDEMQKAIGKYMAWGQKLRERKQCLANHKLTDGGGRVLRGQGKPRVTDGPFTEGKEVLGGYYLVEAPNYDAAVECASGCPHLEYGGTVEVREVDRLPGQ